MIILVSQKNERRAAVKNALSITLNYNTTFWYLDAVEVALCFGWIDNTAKMQNTPNVVPAQRFTKHR